MTNIYFPDEEIKFDDLVFICYMLERIARKQHIFNKEVLQCIPVERMYHLISCAQVLHCENPEKVEDEWIEEYNIPQGTYDCTNVDPTLDVHIPSATDMGKVFARLIRDTELPDEDYVQGLYRVFRSPIIDDINNYNCSAFYEPPYFLARAYLSGGFYH